MLFKTNTNGHKQPSMSLFIIEQDTISETKENNKWGCAASPPPVCMQRMCSRHESNQTPTSHPPVRVNCSCKLNVSSKRKQIVDYMVQPDNSSWRPSATNGKDFIIRMEHNGR